MKVILYSTINTSRLQYICHFIFIELLRIDLNMSSNVEAYKSFNGVKLNYSQDMICEKELHISPVGLLFQQNITSQSIDCFEVNNNKAFFKTSGTDFPFDIFAASFYLLSRYEEYLPHKKDMYGRYAHENSLAFKEGFLHLPLINIWVKDLASAILKVFPDFTINPSPFSFTPTYDIDIAYSYKHKGLLRNIGGFLRTPAIDRIKVLCGLEKDPFDVYEWLQTLHEKFELKPIYFFLVADQNGVYDKNISPDNTAMRQLVNQHAKKYTIGIHPSWQSADDSILFKNEKVQLEKMSQIGIANSRQHYIRFNLPQGYRSLLQTGITDDHSMGYGSINGFRASVASSFNWFDVEKNEETSLRIHPFCYMEANAYYEQKITAEEAFKELMQYYAICKEVNGTLITIWHNHMLGNDKLYEGWGAVYEKFLNRIFVRKEEATIL